MSTKVTYEIIASRSNRTITAVIGVGDGLVK